jgi:hypothetical protein
MSNDELAVLREKVSSFSPEEYAVNCDGTVSPDFNRFYGPLRNYVKMVARGYHRLFMLDARGGLGKTYNVKDVLSKELPQDKFTHCRGFTTPLELYKTLYLARRGGHILFLDDMSGIRSAKKALDMLKAATESDGAENWVQYRSSQDIEHPDDPFRALPQEFCFNGRIIMSFNETPDTPDFEALKDRGVYYRFNLDYEERINLIKEAAKVSGFSELPITEQMEVAEWIADVTNPAVEVSLRTFEEVCSIRHFGQEEGQDWERMAFEVFNLDEERYLITRLRTDSDLSISEQIDVFKEQTGKSQGYYYDLWAEIKDERKG